MKSSGRLLIASLLLLSPFVASAFGSLPQAGTTVTSFSTLTTSVTATSYSYRPLSTTVSTRTISETLASDDFELQSAGRYCYYYYYYKFPLQQGQHLSGAWKSNVSLTFLVLGSDQLAAVKYCEAQPTGLLRSSGMSYDFEFFVPKDDEYYFVFINEAQFRAGIHFELAMVTTATVATTVQTTMAQPYVMPWTQTISTAYTQGATESLTGSSTWLIIVGVVVAVVLLGALFILRARSRQKAGGAKAQLCASCGGQLPRNAKFCKKCGKPTS